MPIVIKKVAGTTNLPKTLPVVVVKKVVAKKAAPVVTKPKGDGISAADAPRKVIYFSAVMRKYLPALEKYVAAKNLSWNEFVHLACMEYAKNHK